METYFVWLFEFFLDSSQNLFPDAVFGAEVASFPDSISVMRFDPSLHLNFYTIKCSLGKIPKYHYGLRLHLIISDWRVQYKPKSASLISMYLKVLTPAESEFMNVFKQQFNVTDKCLGGKLIGTLKLNQCEFGDFRVTRNRRIISNIVRPHCLKCVVSQTLWTDLMCFAMNKNGGKH